MSMIPKLYLAGIIFTTVLALISFFLIINFISPENADKTLLSLIYFSLFIGLSGIFTIIGFAIRRKRQKNQMSLELLGISFRQGMLLGLLMAGCLFLRSYNLYWWLSGLALLILILVIEFFFLRKDE